MSKSKEHGFDLFRRNLSTFRLRNKRDPSKVKMMLGVHVDDIIIAISYSDCNAQVRFLRESLLTIDLGELTFKAGCAIERDRERGALKLPVRPLISTRSIVLTKP